MDYGFTLVVAEMWKKLEPHDETRASDLLAISIVHLQAGRWECARYVSDFIVRDRVFPRTLDFEDKSTIGKASSGRTVTRKSAVKLKPLTSVPKLRFFNLLLRF
jgi:hypothetical protein